MSLPISTEVYVENYLQMKIKLAPKENDDVIPLTEDSKDQAKWILSILARQNSSLFLILSVPSM